MSQCEFEIAPTYRCGQRATRGSAYCYWHIKTAASAAPQPEAPTLADELVARARELAGCKYQYHTIHVPAVLNALAARIESLQAESDQWQDHARRAWGELDEATARYKNAEYDLAAKDARIDKLRQHWISKGEFNAWCGWCGMHWSRFGPVENHDSDCPVRPDSAPTAPEQGEAK